MKEFYYKNNLGIPKKLEVYEEQTDNNGAMLTIIWSMHNGELCSSGYNSKEQISNFLKNYGIVY